MKKVLLIALSAAALSLSAQNNNDVVPPRPIEQSKFSLGVMGGFGHSFLIPYDNSVFRPSWNAGLSAVYAPGNHWGVGIDALYSVEGPKLEYTDNTGSNYTIQDKLGYIRVPVKVIYFFRGYDKDFRPKLSIGPTLGVLVEDKNRPNPSPVDFGATLSAGFNYRVARAIWISVDASYYQGLIDAYGSNSFTELNGNVKLNAGINFGF